MSTRLKENWLKNGSESILKTPFFSIRRDNLINKNTNQSFDVTVMEAKDAVNVIAITEDNQVVFAKQYRFGIQDVTVELPGGLMEEGETPIQAGVRELKEETGYVGQSVEYLGKTASHPVIMNSFIHHVLVKNAKPTGILNFDNGELVENELIPLEAIKNKMKEGYFDHPHTLAALVRYL